MTETQIIKTEDIFKIELSQLDTFQDARNKQLKLLEDCPYVAIEDGKTHDAAKRNRTALRSGRTDLEKGQKAILNVVNSFKAEVTRYTDELISITRPAEDKQQAEITRYEDEREAEKKRKEEEERQRKESIKKSIVDFRNRSSQSIATATFNTIEGIQKDILETVLECAECQEDFESIKTDLSRSVEAKRLQLEKEEEIRIKQIEIQRCTYRFIELKKWGYIYPGEDLGQISETNFLKIRDEQRVIYQNEQTARVKAEEERKRIEKEQREKADELARKEAELKANEERIAREEEEKRLKSEREAQSARKAEELRLKEEADAKIKSEREAAEVARQEALKPDKQKMTDILENLSLQEPDLSDDDMKREWGMVRESFRCFVIEQVTIINNL